VDIAALVNVRARRGSEAVARTLHAELPGARVRVSRSLADAEDFAREILEDPPEMVLAAGGDGTAVGFINAMRAQSTNELRPVAPAIAVLPLGTGNGWAHATGAHTWRRALRELGNAERSGRPLRFRSFDLVETCGLVGPFAGTGWDAELIDDFHAQKQGFSLMPKRARHGLPGYLNALLTRVAPRHMFQDRVQVEVVNLGEDALGVDDAGKPYPLPGGEHGKVLYRGPTSVCGAGTSEEWGFRFRAFPFAQLVRGRMNFRIYAAGAAQGLAHSPRLWRGEHPLPFMSSWLVTKVRATFSRPVPFQVGGDRVDHRDTVEYGIAPFEVDLLDWSKLS
jgi:hypothetical protein